ncbi:MAG: peptidylprolyl isomerase [Sulfurospirillaceae bacterium]|nr:peptidylprolyl isomerase [Sulfurospirillaceae bacterium]
MITWMQKHKKYLVITIWISTIAFVGAGFVGWGAYDFNTDRAASVAKVGSRKVSVQEFQLAYANHYSFYNNLMEGKLTQEEADKMGLENIVMKNIINQTLLLNFADELGLSVLDSEIKEKIANDEAFKDKGVFNKEIYYATLQNSKIAPRDYENGLKKEILIGKLQGLLKTKPSEEEIKIFTSALFMEDKLSVATVTLDSHDTLVSEKDIETFWSANKPKYLTKKSFTLETIQIPVSADEISEAQISEEHNTNKQDYAKDDGKLMTLEEAKDKITQNLRLKNTKKIALESYLLLKKLQINPTSEITIHEDDAKFPIEKLKNVTQNEVLKPILQDNGYLIARVKSVNFPEPMSYEMAKPIVQKELKEQMQSLVLAKKAQARLETFKGEDIGFVSRDSVKSIAGLDEAKTSEFLNHVFDNNQKKGYKIIDSKAIIYDILEQKLLSEEKSKHYVSLIKENIEQMKQAELTENLIKKLASRYEIEQYYKGK